MVVHVSEEERAEEGGGDGALGNACHLAVEASPTAPPHLDHVRGDVVGEEAEEGGEGPGSKEDLEGGKFWMVAKVTEMIVMRVRAKWM